MIKLTTPKDKEFTTQEILNALSTKYDNAINSKLNTFTVTFHQDLDINLSLDIINIYDKLGWSVIYKPLITTTIFNFKRK